MRKLRFAILRNEKPDDHQLWEAACRERSDIVDYHLIDLTRNGWLEAVRNGKFDGLLARPPAYSSAFKTLYDERVRILHDLLGIPVYPTLEEISIYENKKYFSYWLRALEVPHPRTDVFYYPDEAQAFVETAPLPLVGKTNIGASGTGVRILRERQAALDYVQETFSGKGAARSTGPNWRKKGFAGRVVKKLLRPGELKAKMQHYQLQRKDVQRDFVLFQEFVPHEYEWRCVRIGDSFFAHKKLVDGEMASGTLLKGYENPPLELFDFLKWVTDLRGFWSQSVDLFETTDGQYLVNEMQCIFGQSDPYQMLVDGEPGRYRKIDGDWVFEAGDFNRIQSFALRLDHFIQLIQQQQLKPVS